jgi:lipopolysaccharide/colanic/teichoic acid biosynthesis glycosyltransferase
VSLYRRWVKRAIDAVSAAILLVVLAPLMAVIALAVWASMGTPLFFVQDRPGQNGRVFRIVKFRTMSAARTREGVLLPDAKRLTPLGRFLRATSLDELPELVNVLRGDMSLVGPRPLLVRYLDRYTPSQARRHVIRPGITGWAQVNGRNALSWEEKFALDLWYVDHVSFALDLKVLAMTFINALRRADVSHPGHATMPEFQGTLPEDLR